MRKLFITSDTHFYHQNITTGLSDWADGGQRDFPDEISMTTHLINNINAQAGKDDIIRHGGDWSFGGINKFVEARLRIICDDIRISFGNHDHLLIQNRPIPPQYRDECQNRFGFKCRNLQDLFTQVTLKQTFKIKDITATLSHYAERVWDKSHAGAIQIHGHSHAGLERLEQYFGHKPGGLHPINDFYNKYRTLDGGIDNAFRIKGEYVLFTEDDIYEILSPRPSLTLLDHH